MRTILWKRGGGFVTGPVGPPSPNSDPQVGRGGQPNSQGAVHSGGRGFRREVELPPPPTLPFLPVQSIEGSRRVRHGELPGHGHVAIKVIHVSDMDAGLAEKVASHTHTHRHPLHSTPAPCFPPSDTEASPLL